MSDKAMQAPGNKPESQEEPIRKFFQMSFADAFDKSVTSFYELGKNLVMDLVSGVTNMFAETINRCVSFRLFKDDKAALNSSRGGAQSRINYSGIYKSKHSESQIAQASPNGSNLTDYENIQFGTRGEAEVILSTLDEMVDRYGVVRVSDIFDQCGRTCTNPQATKFGWSSMSGAKVIYDGGSYYLRFPRPFKID